MLFNVSSQSEYFAIFIVLMMRVSEFAAAALVLQCAHVDSTMFGQLQAVHVLQQPVTQSLSRTTGSLLASIEYNISTFESTVLSYLPPATSDSANEPKNSHPLIRIATDSPDGSTTITSLSTFNPAYTQTLTLHLRDDDFVFAASFSADTLIPPPISQQLNKNLKVVLLQPQPGPTPKLNVRKPPVLDADGNEIPQTLEEDKSFFQKYWWAFALVAMLALAGGGNE